MENRIPLNLQFFADGGEGAEAQSPAESPNQSGSTDGVEKSAGETVNAAQLAETLIKAVESRTQRAERATVRSIAEQYGMQEADLTAILEKARAERESAIPESAQKQIDAANEQAQAAQEKANGMMVAAEVRAIGAEMGLIDPQTALLLLDKKGVTVNEAGEVTGVQEALETLKKAKPYLFGASGAWGQKQTSQSDDAGGSAAQIEKRYHEKRYGKAKE